MHVPADAFGGMSPEYKAAGALKNLFTMVAIRVVMAQEQAHPAPRILHPAPWTLHHGPCTLDPTPWTPHPGPCTLNPVPWTLHTR
jgi:hypothetical protein